MNSLRLLILFSVFCSSYGDEEYSKTYFGDYGYSGDSYADYAEVVKAEATQPITVPRDATFSDIQVERTAEPEESGASSFPEVGARDVEQVSEDEVEKVSDKDVEQDAERVAEQVTETDGDFCANAKATCREQTCAGSEVAVNTCEKGDDGYSTECSCSSGSSMSSSLFRGSSDNFVPSAAMMRSAPIDVMFSRRFGPFDRSQQDDFGLLSLGGPRLASSMLLSRMVDDRLFAQPRLPSFFSSAMPVLVAEEEPQQGLDRASSGAGFVLDTTSGAVSPFSFRNFSPARMFSISFEPLPISITSDVGEAADETTGVEVLGLPEIRFTDSQGAGNTLQADAKADRSSAFVTDSDSDTKMGGCMVFMLLLFILSASLCCCCCGRRHESEPEEVTVNVVDVEAFTPLMETYVETDSTEFISPLKPLEHEEALKEPLGK